MFPQRPALQAFLSVCTVDTQRYENPAAKAARAVWARGQGR
ncbi:hypothetical protein PUN4_190014 [Paraburkholderia unamae]|nr:hypothetical protein PUN4_190014 [Paraburkholderia unamae]